ncbi:DUF2167 domain-containing protein [Methylocystis sp. WRRC1]|uniref:DUF2167 domain-containing protein n=1 Tax=Methylocystis sp. WRRC1 TaxID=1732014 RepID=UPI001D14DB37|nr:DUF2167 domain-containing protein [Methylocystis sp. WRRC1]
MVQEITPPSQEETQEIIYEMPPMRPVKKSVYLTEPGVSPGADVVRGGEPARRVGPVKVVEPAKMSAPVKMREAAKTVEPPKTVEPVRPAATTPMAAPAPSPEQPIAQAAPEPEAETAPGGQPLTDAPPPAEAAVASETPINPPAPENKEASKAGGETPEPLQAQAEAEAAAPEPIAATMRPPLMTEHPTQKSLVGAGQPSAKLQLQSASTEDPALVPGLKPALQAGATPVASAAQASEQPPAAESPTSAAEQATIEPKVAPPAANDNATAAQAPAPGEPAQDQTAAAEARIAALFAEGVKGPAEVRIADRATMWLPAGRVFIPLEPARKIAREAGLDLRSGAQGLVAPGVDKLDWLATVELLDDGYIKASEPEALQPEKLLAAFEASLPEVNAQRGGVGQPPVTLGGWLTPPALDARKRLSACVSIETQTEPGGADRFFNCEAWALGRQGAIKVSLADGGEQAERLKGEAAALVETIVYDRGKAYEEVDLAADKVAPYAAADLLTRDVSAKSIAPIAPVEAEAPKAPVAVTILILIAKLWKVGLFAVAAIGSVLVWMRRKRSAAEAASAPAKTARVETPAPEKEAPAMSAEARPSLFARLLPTLHARFAAKEDKSVAAPTQAAGDLAASKVESGVTPKSRAPREKSAVSVLLGKFTSLRSAGKGSDDKASPAPIVKKVEGKPAAVEGADEPVSALKKLAMKMRRSGPEPETPSVDLSRAMRTTRTLPGAASEGVAAGEPKAEMGEPGVENAPPAPVNEATAEADVFGLIEPGDEAATSAAINAGRALRAAGG